MKENFTHTTHRATQFKKGQFLIIVYLVMTVFIILSMSLLAKAIFERNSAERNRLRAEAFYLAEGANENAISAFTLAIANFQVSAVVDSFNVATVYSTFGGLTVNTVITRLESSDRLIIEGQTNVYVCNYEVVSTVTHPQNNSVSVTVHQIIARRLIPTFQHTIFYTQDLEIQPGPTMTLTGRIHSNNDIYIDCYDNGATLTIDSEHLRSAGHIFHGRKIDRRHSQGEVRIKKAGTGSYNDMNPGAPSLNTPPYYDSESWPQDDGSWAVDAPLRWAGTVQDSTHGVTSLATPAVASIQTNGYYSQNAGLYVYNDNVYAGVPPALGGTGALLQEGSGPGDLPVGTITKTDQFKNNRENKFISMTDIDMQKLSGYVDDNDKLDGIPSRTPRLPTNGLIYVTRNEAVGSGEQPGIRLKKGTEIGLSGGLTVVSNNPVYILGNYNTITKKPAAIICDALNILSNAWNSDADSRNYLAEPNYSTYRTASATTVNAAFIAGIETTTAGVSDGGGFQNYPRLHEKWSGIQLSITGSFVSLGASQVATGHYQWGPPQYYPPNRNWQWESAFADPAKLPPFTPMAVEAQRIAWWAD